MRWLALLGTALVAALALAPSADASFRCPRVAAPGDCGDGGAAARAGLAQPTDVAALPGGGFAIADSGNDAIRIVGADGRIRTLAGRHLRAPTAIAVAGDGRLIVADTGHDRVVALDRRGRVSVLAAGLAGPQGVAIAADGDVLIADTDHDRVLAVSRGGGPRVLAGSGLRGFSGDGGAATSAQLDRPVDVAPALGGVIIASADGRLRRVAADGTITSLLGAPLQGPPGIAATADGRLLASAPGARTILRIAADGTRTLLAGGGSCGASASRRIAAAAGLSFPAGVSASPDGGVLVADSGAQRIVQLAGDRVRVVAGAGLGVPRSPCAAGNAPARIVTRRGPAPGAADSQYEPPPSCSDRNYWIFNLEFLFLSPKRPRAHRAFTAVFNSSRPVRVRLVATRGHLSKRVPSSTEAVTHHAQFRLKFSHGLPRAGKYKLRLTARAQGTTECLNLTVRVRR